jgi:hypothetical protein
VAAVSTVLISRAGVNAFHAAFWVVFAIAVSGAMMAAIASPRRTTTRIKLDPASSHAPILPEPTNASGT